MNTIDIFNILTMIGGLALFLYGMNIMGDGLSQMAGGKLESVLESGFMLFCLEQALRQLSSPLLLLRLWWLVLLIRGLCIFPRRWE